MMSDTKINFSCLMFRSKDEERENDRDYSGSAVIDRVEYWMSAWINQGTGGKFLRITSKSKNAPTAKSNQSVTADRDDEVQS